MFRELIETIKLLLWPSEAEITAAIVNVYNSLPDKDRQEVLELARRKLEKQKQRGKG